MSLIFSFSSIIVGTFLIIYFIINIFYEFLAGENHENLTLSQILNEGVSKEYTWVIRLTINCIGYSGSTLIQFFSFNNSD